MKNEDISQIYEIISKLNQPEKVEKFFSELLTESELKDVAQRWKIMKMMVENQSQRNISKELSVSLCKVTRGSKILKDGQSIIRKILFDEGWRN